MKPDEISSKRSRLSAAKRSLLERQLRGEAVADSRTGAIGRRSGEGMAPLSFAQQRLWFLEQQEPDGPAYNIPIAISLSGLLNESALMQSFNEIIRRHEILRTTFAKGEREPSQFIAPARIQRLDVADLRNVAEKDPAQRVRQLALQESQRPFDLVSGPLIRTTLLRLQVDQYLLLVTMHHLISDEWSIRILTHEMATLYEVYSIGEPSLLPTLPIQYADYTCWQRQGLDERVMEDQVAYWKGQLGAQVPVLDLSISRPRPSVQTYRGSRQSLTLSEPLCSAIKVFSQRNGVTLFMTLLAAFKVLLHRYTGQDDIVVGTAVSNRNRAEVEGLIGLFVNMLVLRTVFNGNPCFRELLKRVRQTVLGALANQDLPFEKLVAELNPERDLSRTPLFQVMYVLDNVPRKLSQLPGITSDIVQIDNRTAKFDLTLFIMDHGAGFILLAEYNVDLFDALTITRLLRHLEALLGHTLAAPEQRVSTLPLLTQAEIHQLLIDWNETQVEYPRASLLHELVQAQAEQTPDAVALSFQERQFSYGELNRRANQIGHYLQNMTVMPEVLVGLCVERSPELVMAMLGVLKSGDAYIPLDPSYPRERLEFIFQDSNAPLLLTQKSLAGIFSNLPIGVISIDSDWDRIAREPSDNLRTRSTSDSLAYVIYTSGSTGRPKGVQVTHRSVVNFLGSMRQKPGLADSDRLLAVTTLSFDISALELFLPLTVGGCVVIGSRDVATDGVQLARKITSESITTMQATPATWRLLESIGWEGNRNLKILCGGEALPPDLTAKLSERCASLWNMYGPTETTIWSTTYQIDPEAPKSLIGQPIANTQVFVLDGNLEPVPVGIPGELYIGGEGLARGYLEWPELTAEKFIPNPFRQQQGSVLYRTGDLARYLPDGTIEFIGRLDQQVKIRGFRIELGEVVAVLSQYPGVHQVVALAREDAPQQQRLVAYFISEEDPAPTPNDLYRFAIERLPAYMAPSIFVSLKALPLLPNGKVDIQALPPPDKTRLDSDRTFITPRSPVEEILMGIWAQVLGVESVSANDHFFALGGDSIRCGQVVSKAQARGLNLSIQMVFRYPTIHQLAQAIGESEAGLVEPPSSQPFDLIAEEDRLKLIPGVEDAYPITRLQAGMFFHSQWNVVTYHYLLSIHLRFPFDVAALQQSLGWLAARHSILRTSFDLANYSEPLQLVHKRVSVPIYVKDLRLYSPATQEQVLASWMVTEQHQGFDLMRAPLLRVFVHRRTEELSQFTLSFHHAILDGWSLALMLTELFELYLALLGGKSRSLARPPATSYRDFVALEQMTLRSEVTKNYWEKKLADCTIMTLPAGAGGEVASHQPSVGAIDIPIPADTFHALTQLARLANVPIKSVLLAAYLRVMSMLSGQPDVLAGVVSHGRMEGNEGEQVLGLFLHTIPFRLELKGGAWLDLVVQVFKAEQESFPHRRYPVAELQRKQAGQALFEAVFNFTHYHIYDGLKRFKELEVLGVKILDQTNFPLLVNFSIDPSGSDLTVLLQYDQSRFSRRQIIAMSVYFTTALEQLSRHSSERYETLNLLSPMETHRLLVEWNDTLTGYSLDKCVHELMQAQAERAPDAVALCADAQHITYQELNCRSNQLARYLQERGVGPESRVGLYIDRSLEMVVGLLGILKAGGAYVPLDLAYPPGRLAFVLQDANALALITQQTLAQQLPKMEVEVICLDAHWPDIAQQSVDDPSRRTTSRNAAYVMYTSGSTGQPKGVMVQHRSLINFFHSMDLRVGCDSTETLLAVTSIAFDISVLELVWTLTRGAKVVLFSEWTDRNLSERRKPRADKEIAFSLFYFANEDSETAADKYELLLEAARFADQHGFEAVWTPERHFNPFGGLYANPSVTSAALATITGRVKLRAGSVVLPLHDPIRVAEEWSMVDGLSKGRVGIAFASGWHANDFTFFPQNYGNRRDVTWRNLEVVKKLWRGESIVQKSGAEKEIEVRIYPKPIQSELPIWITAGGAPETFIKAGELGANVLTHLLGQTLEEVAHKIKLYRATRAKHGHDPDAGRVTLMLHTFIGQDTETVREKVRGPFLNYLRSSVDLISSLFKTLRLSLDLQTMSEQDTNDLLIFAFNRYFETSALFGTPDSCRRRVETLKEIGVDEVACLIDFGVDKDSILASLHNLNELKELSNHQNGVNRDPVPEPAIPPGISMMQCTPSLMKLLSLDRDAMEAFKSLRILLLGGEALPPALVKQIQETLPGKLVNMYGPTETTIWSTTCEVSDATAPISIGRPIANTRVYCLDQHLQPAPACVAGELYIGGAGLARGYIGQPGATAERFVPDVFSISPGARLYRTGDLGNYLPDGRIEFLGRIDHQVKLRGIRVELGEIEALLTKHPAVKQVVVLAREDLPGDTRLVAYIVPSELQAPTTVALRRHLQSWLPDYLIPSAFVILEALPLSVSGKVDRHSLPAPDGNRSEQGPPFVAPRTVTESDLAEIWREILRLEQIGLHDNFFEIGGHSLMAVQLVSRIKARFGVELPLRDLFGSPTLESLAARVDEATLAQTDLSNIDQMLDTLESIDEDEAWEMLHHDEAHRDGEINSISGRARGIDRVVSKEV